MHEELNITHLQKTNLAAARAAVRGCLRIGIPFKLKELGFAETVPVPRFFTQGSWAYRTLNAPAKRSQQADLDDGCYFPLSFLSLANQPSTASEIFFAAVEDVLKPLVDKMGWKLIKDKSTCIRIIIDIDAHIDIPLYAIPDAEFETLTEAALTRYGYDSLEEAMIKAEHDAWTALPHDKVLLAHREKNWISSDPRPIKEWFIAEVMARGEQLRRTVRYLKAFRDWTWVAGGPSSILLMAVAVPIFEKRDRRDDLALLEVVSALPDALRAGVCNPVDESESLTDRLGDAGVQVAANEFKRLEKALRDSTAANTALEACEMLRGEFGPRFPNEPDRVKVVSVAATIAATPASTGPSELVGRTKAG